MSSYIEEKQEKEDVAQLESCMLVIILIKKLYDSRRIVSN